MAVLPFENIGATGPRVPERRRRRRPPDALATPDLEVIARSTSFRFGAKMSTHDRWTRSQEMSDTSPDRSPVEVTPWLSEPSSSTSPRDAALGEQYNTRMADISTLRRDIAATSRGNCGGKWTPGTSESDHAPRREQRSVSAVSPEQLSLRHLDGAGRAKEEPLGTLSSQSKRTPRMRPAYTRWPTHTSCLAGFSALRQGRPFKSQDGGDDGAGDRWIAPRSAR